MLSIAKAESVDVVETTPWLLTAICVQAGTFANVWTWQGWYSTNIGNSRLWTSENKSKDHF